MVEFVQKEEAEAGEDNDWNDWESPEQESHSTHPFPPGLLQNEVVEVELRDGTRSIFDAEDFCWSSEAIPSFRIIKWRRINSIPEIFDKWGTNKEEGIVTSERKWNIWKPTFSSKNPAPNRLVDMKFRDEIVLTSMLSDDFRWGNSTGEHGIHDIIAWRLSDEEEG